MPIPDRHKDEPVTSLNPDLWHSYGEASRNASAWAEIARKYRAEIEAQLNASGCFAAAVNGVKVVTFRPSDTYAVKALREQFPELTAHYVRTVVKEVEEFDMDLFARAKPEIAEQFRVRSFREVRGRDQQL